MITPPPDTRAVPSYQEVPNRPSEGPKKKRPNNRDPFLSKDIFRFLASKNSANLITEPPPHRSEKRMGEWIKNSSGLHGCPSWKQFGNQWPYKRMQAREIIGGIAESIEFCNNRAKMNRVHIFALQHWAKMYPEETNHQKNTQKT